VKGIATRENMQTNEYIDEQVKKRIELLLQEKPQRDVYKRFTILSYQLADVGRDMRYMEIYPDDRAAYLAHLKTALADLIMQAMVISELYHLDVSELVKLGSERLEEFRKKGRYEET
jgi:hypothetical protein